jgi:hypothetical protein
MDVAQWRGPAKLRINAVKVRLQPRRKPTLHGTTTGTTEMSGMAQATGRW